jgi:hypothetical protein
MRKILWKSLAVLPLLGLTLWWIHSDVQETGGVSASPLGAREHVFASAPGAAPPFDSGPASAGQAVAASHALGSGRGSAFGQGFGPGIDPHLYADSPAVGDPAWRQAALWDDGKAEFCAYEVSWAHYGHRYNGRALLVLVKEPWQPALEVKADHPGRDSFEVLKLNHVRDVATGIYTYHQMASAFWRRDSGALQKIAATSSEACGIAYAEMTRGKLQTHGYFDGEGDRVQRWPAGAVPEDGLPAALRTWVTGIPPYSLDVFPSLLAGRYADLGLKSYRLERRPATVTAVEAAALGPSLPGASAPGSGGAAAPPAAIEMLLTSGRARLSYTFESQLPHRLLRFERDDGTTYRLAKCGRIPYWQMHDPGGESWLPPAVR